MLTCRIMLLSLLLLLSLSFLHWRVSLSLYSVSQAHSTNQSAFWLFTKSRRKTMKEEKKKNLLLFSKHVSFIVQSPTSRRFVSPQQTAAQSRQLRRRLRDSSPSVEGRSHTWRRHSVFSLFSSSVSTDSILSIISVEKKREYLGKKNHRRPTIPS